VRQMLRDEGWKMLERSTSIGSMIDDNA
jgi:hypothetical protein